MHHSDIKWTTSTRMKPAPSPSTLVHQPTPMLSSFQSSFYPPLPPGLQALYSAHTHRDIEMLRHLNPGCVIFAAIKYICKYCSDLSKLYVSSPIMLLLYSFTPLQKYFTANNVSMLDYTGYLLTTATLQVAKSKLSSPDHTIPLVSPNKSSKH